MKRAICAATLILIAACAAGVPTSVREGQELLASIVPPGTPIDAARRTLSDNDVVYSDVPTSDCNPYFLAPRFSGKGGPAIWAELNASTRPWNPIYSPSLVGFLAFSESGVLVSSVVAFEGGDR